MLFPTSIILEIYSKMDVTINFLYKWTMDTKLHRGMRYIFSTKIKVFGFTGIKINCPYVRPFTYFVKIRNKWIRYSLFVIVNNNIYRSISLTWRCIVSLRHFSGKLCMEFKVHVIVYSVVCNCPIEFHRLTRLSCQWTVIHYSVCKTCASKVISNHVHMSSII